MNKDGKKSLFDIYRACRLCGGGAGYKMPIIQDIIEIEPDYEIALQEKIKDCVHIEVDQNDKMPPLICELCVDKVNDFYDFMKLCQQTNKVTRLRLGLPLHLQVTGRGSVSKSTQTTKDKCSSLRHRGTETVDLNCNSDDETLAKSKDRNQKSKSTPRSLKEREQARTKSESQSIRDSIKFSSSRESSPEVQRQLKKRSLSPTRSVSPKRTTRQTRTDNFIFEQLEDDLNKIKQKPTVKSSKDGKTSKEARSDPKERDKQKESQAVNIPIVSKTKRLRDSSIDAATPPNKKSKETKCEKKPNLDEDSPKPRFTCLICSKSFSRKDRLNRHKNIEHPEIINFTLNKIHSCEVCHSTFAKSGNLGRHRKLQHPELDFQNINTTSKDDKSDKPGPKSKTARPQHQPTPNKVELKKKKPKESKGFKCTICGATQSNHQLYISHSSQYHVPVFTTKEKSCNACEQWFETEQEANEHHGKHSSEAIPYSCNKCYGEFTDMASYELHFKMDECLSNYESPDVKCDECWRTFPTYKLLEDHRCPGETARPGGNCSKCNKSFSLLRNQVIHEMKCTLKRNKKSGIDEPVDLEKANNLLPMEVRIIKCDSLLKKGNGTSVDVGQVSHTFGLDRQAIYPYFYSKGSYKNESFDAMVSVADDIKQEYSTFVHWDSDDEDSYYFTKKTVDSLAVLSLKTLFSSKCLGKVPRKLRENIEKKYDSIMSINFSDLKSNIESIIGDLDKDDDASLVEDKENNRSDNPVENDGKESNRNSSDQYDRANQVSESHVVNETGSDDKQTDDATDAVNQVDDENDEKNETGCNENGIQPVLNDNAKSVDESRNRRNELSQENGADLNDNDNLDGEEDLSQENDVGLNKNDNSIVDTQNDEDELSEENDKSTDNLQDNSTNDLRPHKVNHKAPNIKHTIESLIRNPQDESTNALPKENAKVTTQTAVNDNDSSQMLQHEDLNADRIEENATKDETVMDAESVEGKDTENNENKAMQEKMDVDSQNTENNTEFTMNTDLSVSTNNVFRDVTKNNETNGDFISLNSGKSNLDLNEDTKDLIDRLDEPIGEGDKNYRVKSNKNDLSSLDLDSVSDEELSFD